MRDVRISSQGLSAEGIPNVPRELVVKVAGRNTCPGPARLVESNTTGVIHSLLEASPQDPALTRFIRALYF